MSTRFILREPYQGRVVPRPDLGLYSSRKAAKAEAKRLGFPTNLIHTVRRRPWT